MPTRRLCLLLCVMLSPLALAADPPPGVKADVDGFVPLFNGKDLTGWVPVNVATGTASDTFTVKDGMIHCTGLPTGVMRTERMYENFVVELEWRHMVPGRNSGFFLFSDALTSKGVPFSRGLEVQILDGPGHPQRNYTTQGDLFPIHGATAKPDNPGKWAGRSYPTEDRTKPSPEWNHYRVEAINGNVTLAVNGKVVNSTKDVSPRKGYLCLESEGGVVHFRNLRIKELPPSDKLDAKHVATADEGFKSLYTGIDLTGWVVDDRIKREWVPKDWTLHFEPAPIVGGIPLGDSSLRSQNKYKALELILDFRQPTAAQFFVYVGGYNLMVLPPAPAAAGAKPGWRRLHVKYTGPALSATVDGAAIPIDWKPGDPVREAPLIFNPTTPTDFANVYVKPLP
jgi:hypothetical protein